MYPWRNSVLPERLSLVDATLYLIVRRSTMYKLTSTREIPFNKFGRSIFFYTQQLDNLLKDNAPRYKSRGEIENEASEDLSNVARKKLNRMW